MPPRGFDDPPPNMPPSMFNHPPPGRHS
jgi:hypothetical protein